ncbi:hypothetical protein BDP27DRAFT_1326639, partial [Rhodocollybia butyracea]
PWFAPIFLWAHCRDDSSRIGPEVKAYSLTSLRLSLKPFKAYGTTEFLPSMSQLLDIIDQNPLLTILSLEYSGRVLDCVPASIHISCHAWNRTDPSIRDGKEACDLLPSLTRHLSPLKNEAGSHGPFTKLYILPHDSIEGSPISWDLSLPVAFPSVWNYIQTLNAVFDALPCTKGIKELSLIIALFRNMQNVDTLSISNIGDQTLDPIAVALDSMTFFPCLKDVSVYSGNSTFFPKLQKCLGNRKQRGSELEKIEFRGCTVTAFQVDTFRDVVKAVYWDEVEQPVT